MRVIFYQCTSQWPTSTSSNHFQMGSTCFFLLDGCRWSLLLLIDLQLSRRPTYPGVWQQGIGCTASIVTECFWHLTGENVQVFEACFAFLVWLTFCYFNVTTCKIWPGKRFWSQPWSGIIKWAVIMEPFNLCVGGVGWCEEATLSGAVSRDAQWLRLGVYLTLSEFICLPKPVSLYQIYEPKQILMNQAELVSTRSVVFT